MGRNTIDDDWEGNVLVDHGAGKYDKEMARYTDALGPGRCCFVVDASPFFFKLVYISSGALVPWVREGRIQRFGVEEVAAHESHPFFRGIDGFALLLYSGGLSTGAATVDEVQYTYLHW